jgi:hypothetical protein
MNKDLKTEWQLNYDKGDAWGSCMQWLFAVCDYLTFQTDEGVPDDWQFRPSPFGANEDCFCYQTLRHLAFEKYIETDDVLHFGSLLVRFSELLKRKGLDY